MSAAGLFVGVGHQTDERIDALKFAARDATALWAAIADWNESSGHPPELAVLLKNADATVPNVLQALETLARSSREQPFDFLHIHFSCHGTPDGRLVLADAVWGAHEASTLPLASITERVTAIRSFLTMVTFDSCFSGTVMGIENSPNAAAFQELLHAMGNETRAVAWAAGPTERAWESPVLSHGYFTFGLINTVREGRAMGRGRIEIAAWLQGAINFAATQTRTAGRPQNPHARVDLAAGADIQLPPDGLQQRAFRAEAGIQAVGENLEDLRHSGLGGNAIAALRARLDPGGLLNHLQRQAIAPGGLLAGRNVVIRAPTSAGKTVVGELAVLAQLEQGRKAVVLLPTRALVHEQADRFARAYTTLGCRVVRSAGDAAEQDALLFGQHFDVAFMTYEKFAALSVCRPSILSAVGCVVVDELQQISDSTRGAVIELILTRLMQHRRRTGQKLQIVGLCANVTDLNRLPEWLEAEPVGDGTRPVPLHETVLAPSGRSLTRTDGDPGPVEGRMALQVDVAGLPFRDREHAVRGRLALALIGELVREGHQVLVFCATKTAVVRLAEALARTSGLPGAEGTLTLLQGQLPSEADRSRAHTRLRESLLHGVAFHIADLDRVEREAVEGGFRLGEIRILVATTTLAMGVNTPANAVVIVDSELPSGEGGAMEPVDVTTYRNMAGRAGRLGLAQEGNAYLLAESDAIAQPLWDRYVAGPAERLDSVLDRSSDADVVLALAAQVGLTTITDLVSTAQRTYMGYLKRADDAWWADRRTRLREAAVQLVGEGYLVAVNEPEYCLSDIGKVCGLMGLRKESAQRLLRVIDAMIAARERIDEGELVALAQLTVELDEMYVPLAPGEARTWVRAPNPWLDARPTLAEALRADPDERLAGARLKRLGGIRLWMRGEPRQQIEAAYDGRPNVPAFGVVRRAADRTSDMIVPVAALVTARQLHRRGELRGLVAALHWRLDLGAPGEAVGLLRLNHGLSRHQANELTRQGIVDEEQLQLALEQENPAVFGLLTTPIAHQLRQRLQGMDPGATQRNPRRDQHVLDLFRETDQL